MIILDSTSKSLIAKLGGAVSTANPEFAAAYANTDGTVFTEGSNDGVLNGTSEVTLVAAPAAGNRIIVKDLAVCNLDTANVTLIVQVANGATRRTVYKKVLVPGDTFTFQSAIDWKKVDHGETLGLGDDDHTIYAKRASNLSDLQNGATARTNLGLGTGDTPLFAGLVTSGTINSTKDKADTGELGAHFVARGNSDNNKVLSLGFQTTANYGWIQASQFGTGVKPLILQPNGGSVGIGVASPGATLDLGSGGQIKFPATQNPSTDVNVLDDYEEGSWTPTIGGNATYNIQQGTYTKIGRLVYVQCRLLINALGTGSTIIVTGLPFNPAMSQTLAFAYFSGLSQNVVFLTAVAQPGSGINLYSMLAAGTAVAANGILTNGTEIIFSGCYHI